jgi:hypothetical protein
VLVLVLVLVLLLLVEGVLLQLIQLQIMECFIVHLLNNTVVAQHRDFGVVPGTSVLTFPGKMSLVGHAMVH